MKRNNYEKNFIYFLVVAMIFTFHTTSVFATDMPTSDGTIVNDNSGDWIVLDGNDDIYAIRFYSAEDTLIMPRWAPTTLVEGVRSLTTSGNTYLCTKAAESTIFNENHILELWNGGDEEGNGAITFKVGSTSIAIDSNSGAQMIVKQKTAYSVNAKSNWYDGNFFLKVTLWH